MTASALTDFQIEVAHLFFGLDASDGYVVAGGAALIASDLIDRPTQDLDLFASAPVDSVIMARDSFLAAVNDRGWRTELIHDAPAFCRLVVTGDGDEVLVDLGLDSPPAAAPTVTVLGPTVAPLELAGRKLLALFGRAEIRDFSDVFQLAQRFGKDALIAEATTADPGFDPKVLAQMMTTLDRFTDTEFPSADEDIPRIRAFFAHWSDELR